MRKIIPMITVCMAFLLTICGCQNSKVQVNSSLESFSYAQSSKDYLSSLHVDSSVRSFSYAQDSKDYIKGEPGVHTDGFKNSVRSSADTKEKAIQLAKNEVTLEYNQITTSYDESANMWQISFSLEGVVGDCQSVYLDTTGVTKMIVYGE